MATATRCDGHHKNRRQFQIHDNFSTFRQETAVNGVTIGENLNNLSAKGFAGYRLPKAGSIRLSNAAVPACARLYIDEIVSCFLLQEEQAGNGRYEKSSSVECSIQKKPPVHPQGKKPFSIG
jgi:hypothetical protein